MTTCIALLRGINVGGRNRLSMNELRALLESLGLQSIRTYIQSGNVVFQTAESGLAQLSEQISSAILASHGFEPRVMLLRCEDLDRAIDGNPFPEAEAEPKTLHVAFLDSTPMDPDLKGIEQLRAESERFVLADKVFYLHAPDGIGRSKLATKLERLLGVAATARNWRTVQKVKELIEG